MNKKTKIIATIGPSCDSTEKMKELIMAGVNVFRFNMKHNSVEWHEERIARAAEATTQTGKRIGILIDLQGPEIRIETRDGKDVAVDKGQTVEFVPNFDSTASIEQGVRTVGIPQREVFELMSVGEELLIDDGFQEFEIVEKTENRIIGVARSNYVIKNRKGMNLPGKCINLPSLIAADLDKLDMATRIKVDFVALSFCRTAEDIKILRREMESRNLTAQVVAKIESQESLNNFDEIIQAADVVMVARGDLGVEVPIEQLAFWQKTLIKKCRNAGKPVIVATQMLQSMTENPRPTRAEATDVSNAVWDGTDAVMLSGETASGNYPLKAVEAMAKIVQFNEGAAEPIEIQRPVTDSTQAIAMAARHLAIQTKPLNLAAILVFTQTGYTARSIASFRLETPLIAITDSDKTAAELTMSYGVNAVCTTFPSGEVKVSEEMLNSLKNQNLIKTGELVLAVHGTHWNRAGLTNATSLITV